MHDADEVYFFNKSRFLSKWNRPVSLEHFLEKSSGQKWVTLSASLCCLSWVDSITLAEVTVYFDDSTLLHLYLFELAPSAVSGDFFASGNFAFSSHTFNAERLQLNSLPEDADLYESFASHLYDLHMRSSDEASFFPMEIDWDAYAQNTEYSDESFPNLYAEEEYSGEQLVDYVFESQN